MNLVPRATFCVPRSEQRLIAHVERRLAEQAAAGPDHIESWYQRGYVWFSDRETHSTHLRRVSGDECRVSSETQTSNTEKGGPP